jgi:type III secretion protein R
MIQNLDSVVPSQLLTISLVVALVPLLIGLVTCYVKVSIVMGAVRMGIGATSIPGSVAEGALTLALTLLIMQPTILRGIPSFSEAFQEKPSRSLAERIHLGCQPILEFIERNTDKKDREYVEKNFFQNVGRGKDDIFNKLQVSVLSFLLSELKGGFRMAFIILLPFLLIDLIIGTLLAGVGLSAISPSVVCLPLKLLFFVESNSWLVITKELFASYNVS